MSGPCYVARYGRVTHPHSGADRRTLSLRPVSGRSLPYSFFQPTFSQEVPSIVE